MLLDSTDGVKSYGSFFRNFSFILLLFHIVYIGITLIRSAVMAYLNMVANDSSGYTMMLGTLDRLGTLFAFSNTHHFQLMELSQSIWAGYRIIIVLQSYALAGTFSFNNLYHVLL
jgi:hypothetical protein